MRILNPLEIEKNPLREAIQLEIVGQIGVQVNSEVELFMSLLYIEVMSDSLRTTRFFCPEVFIGLLFCLDFVNGLLDKTSIDTKMNAESKTVLQSWFQSTVQTKIKVK